MRWKTIRRFRTLEDAQAAMQRLRRQRHLDGGTDPLRYWRTTRGTWRIQRQEPQVIPGKKNATITTDRGVQLSSKNYKCPV